MSGEYFCFGIAALLIGLAILNPFKKIELPPTLISTEPISPAQPWNLKIPRESKGEYWIEYWSCENPKLIRYENLERK